MPSTVRSWRRWKRLTARRVAGPKMRSGWSPSIRWSCATRGPFEPRLRSAASAAGGSAAVAAAISARAIASASAVHCQFRPCTVVRAKSSRSFVSSVGRLRGELTGSHAPRATPPDGGDSPLRPPGRFGSPVRRSRRRRRFGGRRSINANSSRCRISCSTSDADANIRSSCTRQQRAKRPSRWSRRESTTARSPAASASPARRSATGAGRATCRAPAKRETDVRTLRTRVTQDRARSRGLRRAPRAVSRRWPHHPYGPHRSAPDLPRLAVRPHRRGRGRAPQPVLPGEPVRRVHLHDGAEVVLDVYSQPPRVPVPTARCRQEAPPPDRARAMAARSRRRWRRGRSFAAASVRTAASSSTGPARTSTSATTSRTYSADILDLFVETCRDVGLSASPLRAARPALPARATSRSSSSTSESSPEAATR